MKKLVLVLVLATAPACVTFREAIEDRLAPIVVRVLRDPESVELLELDPVLIAQRSGIARVVADEDAFHGYEIRKHAPLASVKGRRKLAELLFRGVLTTEEAVVEELPIEPRIALRAVREGQVVDLLIDFDRHHIVVFSPGKTTRSTTSPDVRGEVERIFRVSGIELR